MGEWMECKLGEVIQSVIDNRGKNPPYAATGHEVIETGCISGKNKYPDYSLVKKYVDEDTYTNWFRSGYPQKNDLLIITVGNGIGAVSIMGNDRGVITQNLIGLHFSELGDSTYYYYYLKQEVIQDFLKSMNIGSAQPSLKVPHLLGIEVPHPPLPEQKAIASVLSSLDDKIELLHRQNKTLEAMAETLFRQWFVEEAQEDWITVRVGDFVKTNILSINKDFKLKKIRYLDTGSLTEGKIDGYQTFDIADVPSRARRIAKHNDVLISTVRPNQKHYGILKHPAEDIIVSTGFCVIACDKINPHFIYVLLTTEEMTEYLHSIAEGSTSTYPSLKPSDIENLEFQLPPAEKLNAFSEYADNAWGKIDYNNIQIRTLEKLRDALLPKLMSGEVRVKVIKDRAMTGNLRGLPQQGLSQRKSIRLKGYDYSQGGLYFITICTQNRLCLFGEIQNGEMILNDAGKMVEHQWQELICRFDNIKLYGFIVMPNHFHGIIELVGAPLVGAQNVGQPQTGQPQKIIGQPQGIAPTVGDVAGAFKSLTTNDYIRNVKQNNWQPFKKKLWQRNFYEHIIRDNESYLKIAEYIQANPLKWREDKYYE